MMRLTVGLNRLMPACSNLGLVKRTSLPRRNATSSQSSTAKSSMARPAVGRLSSSAFFAGRVAAAAEHQRQFVQAGIVADQHQALGIADASPCG